MKSSALLLLLLVVIFVMPSTVTAQSDPGTENLTHWWPFDDGTANDKVGAAHGTVIGNAPITNGSLFIESLDQWVELPADIIGIPEYKAVTVAVWFTPTADANNSYHMVVYFGDSRNGFGSNGFFISPCRGDNVSRAAISCGQINNPWEKENGVNGPETNDGILHHMVVTIDDAELNFYVDGDWMGVAELTGDNSLSNISPNYAYIGRGGYTADPVLLSEIHDVRIYNRVLTGDEVAYLYQHFPSAAVQDRADVAPQAFQLAQNYPNPFNPSTTIEYTLRNPGNATLTVYNAAGEKIAVLANGFHQSGLHRVTWRGTDDLGRPVNSGIYFYRLEAEGKALTQKMLLVR